MGYDVGIFAIVSDVEILVIPQHARKGLLFSTGLLAPGKLEFDRCGNLPSRIVKLAIHRDRDRGAFDLVGWDGAGGAPALRPSRGNEQCEDEESSHGSPLYNENPCRPGLPTFSRFQPWFTLIGFFRTQEASTQNQSGHQTQEGGTWEWNQLGSTRDLTVEAGCYGLSETVTQKFTGMERDAGWTFS